MSIYSMVIQVSTDAQKKKFQFFRISQCSANDLKWQRIQMTNDMSFQHSNDKWLESFEYNVGQHYNSCLHYISLFFLYFSITITWWISANQNQMTEMTKWQRIRNNDKWLNKSFKWSNNQVITEHWVHYKRRDNN